mmetsp:Transcript_14092/g.38239  ORF Transcript_14092/g.38239 Transcript_14092/m.38239 type:complete len:85 (-) Transcript_14092:578-832(-)
MPAEPTFTVALTKAQGGEPAAHRSRFFLPTAQRLLRYLHLRGLRKLLPWRSFRKKDEKRREDGDKLLPSEALSAVAAHVSSQLK